MKQPLGIARVMADSLTLWGRHLLRVLPTALVCFLPWAGFWLLLLERRFVSPFAGIVVAMLLRFVSQQIFIARAAPRLAGSTAPPGRFGGALSVGIRSLTTMTLMAILPVLGIGLVNYLFKNVLGQAVGTVMMMVLGLFLYGYVFMSPVALAVEKLAAGPAMERAARLGDGLRLRLLLVLLPIAVLDLIGHTMFVGLLRTHVLFVALLLLETAVVGVLNAAICTSTFQALRVHKEGTPTAELAEVFA